MLRVENLHLAYGRVTALRGVSLAVEPGAMVSIIGPNGAGKTSLLGAIAGDVAAQSGRILFDGAELRGLPSDAIVRRGIALVPEGRHIFASLTVRENLTLGATIRADRAAARADIDRFLSIFPILRERAGQPAGRLSGGEQQQLAIARALLARPRLLMLDEPSLGLAPKIIDQVYDYLAEVRREGVAVLVVEQNAGRALAASDSIHVLNGGTVRLSGSGAEVMHHAGFDSAYFGVAL